MMKFLRVIALVLLPVVWAFAQDTAPVPKPTPPDDEVVKISTNLVQIDMTATDKYGKVLTDLRSDEVEVYQNGKKQEIANFSFILNKRETTVDGEKTTRAKPQQQGVVLPAMPIRTENVKRAIALVVDDLNLSFSSVVYVQRALKSFVDEQMRDGDLVAIIRTGAGIGALQQFTNDKRQLYAAIDAIRYNALGTGHAGAFEALQGQVEPGSSLPTTASDDQKQKADNFRNSVFATGTLGALNYVIRGMAELPGRKSIMLLSDGFALFTKDEMGARDSRVYDAIHVLVDSANRASVVIYSMDPRGLVYTGITAADDTNGRTSDQIAQAETDRIDQMTSTQDGLRFIAHETGGTSILNNNDLSGGIRKILDDQSYYLVGYMPDDSTFDPKARHFNNLTVKVTRPGVSVRYRSGFFNLTDEKKDEAVKMKPANRLANALTSPFAVNDISLHLNPLFGNNPRDGSYIRSLLHFRAQDLTFENQPDGGKKGTIDVLAIAFGDNGNAVDQLSKTITFVVGKDRFQAFLKNGFVGDFVFPIKKPGAYQLRVAIRDHGSEKVGSANQFIEIPDVKKNALVLSGAALEDVSFETWKDRSSGTSKRQPEDRLKLATDTALRQFKRGTVLNYALSIYNASKQSEPSSVTSRVQLYHDGQIYFQGDNKPVTPGARTDPGVIAFQSSISLGTEMPPGDYVMEIVVNVNSPKDGLRTATQFVQFEIVE